MEIVYPSEYLTCFPIHLMEIVSLLLEHQHGITMHNQGLMRESQRGGDHIVLWGGVGRGEVVQLLLCILLGAEEKLLGEGTSSVLPLPFCIKHQTW